MPSKPIDFVSRTVHNLIDDGEPVVWALVGGKRATSIFEEAAEEEVEKRQILRRVECGHLLDARWCRFLKEKQKVLVGRALMARIRLLILDIGGLDPVARENFLVFGA